MLINLVNEGNETGQLMLQLGISPVFLVTFLDLAFTVEALASVNTS